MDEPVVIRKPTTPEEWNDQLTLLSHEQALTMLTEGRAPTSILMMYLKQTDPKYQLECRKIEKEIALMDARISAIESAADVARIMEDGIRAMTNYRTGQPEEDYEDEYEL